MNSSVQILVSCFINSLWEVAAIGMAGWAVNRLFGRLGPRVQHLLWVMTLALAVTTPLFPLLRFLVVQIGIRSVVQDHSSILSMAVVGYERPVSGAVILPSMLILFLFLVFLGTFFGLAARLAWLLYYTSSLLRQGRPVFLRPEVEELWSRCKHAFSLDDVQLLSSDTFASPVTIGFTRPVLLISEAFIRDCAAHDLLGALAHECAHIKRRDFQKNLIYEIATLGIAYHPVTWFLKSQIAQTREMICDEMVGDTVLDQQSYAQALLRLVQRISIGTHSAPSKAIGIFDADILEKRIMMMTKKRQHFSAGWKYGSVVGGALLLFSLATGSGAMAWSVQAQPQETPSKSIPVNSRVRADLSCTFYDPQGQGLDGTCEVHKADLGRYYCAADTDRKMSQEQTGCQWKVERAQSLKGEHLAK